MIKADVEIKKWTIKMRALGKDNLPGAVADSLNAAAAASSMQAKKNVKKSMIVRTKFTLNSIRQDRHARGNSIPRMYSRVGSISPYLAIHDEGGTKDNSGGSIPIPALQARTGKSIQKSIARRYKMNQLGQLKGNDKFFMGTPKGGSRRGGIYERHGKNKLRMIRNVESRQVKIPGRQWFSKAIAKYGTWQFIQSQFIKSAQRRFKGAI